LIDGTPKVGAFGVEYELTDRGRTLEPVLLALGRWGSPLSPQPDSAEELSPDALIVALRTTFDAAAMGSLRGTVKLRLSGDAFLLTVSQGGLAAIRDAHADAALTSTVRTVQDLVFDRRELDDAIRSEAASAEGDLRLLRRLLAAFDDHREPMADAARPPREIKLLAPGPSSTG
jgi:alkyl sulfatase BDS1-like metallo-beta-lactamase superfamily hydrolase